MEEKQNIPAPDLDKPENIDNAFELGAYLVKNWWKAALLAAVVALAMTGYSISCGEFSFQHEPVKQIDGEGK